MAPPRSRRTPSTAKRRPIPLTALVALSLLGGSLAAAGHLPIPRQPHHRLLARAPGDDPQSSSTATADAAGSSTSIVSSRRQPSTSTSTLAHPSASATGTATSSAASSTASVDTTPFTWPQAFDSITVSSFSSSTCPAFFQTFLNDPYVANASPSGCMPLSLLIGTSNSFFTTQRHANTSLITVLDAACAPEPGEDACSDRMTSLANQLQGSCARDLQAGNAFAHQARDGFRSYDVVREATCAKNQATGQYCYVEAVQNSSPSDLYFYLLAQGTSLPSGTNASCSSCTKNLMSIYSQHASNASLPLSHVYAGARTMAAVSCGPDFAPLVATPTGSSTRSSSFSRDSIILLLASSTFGLALSVLVA